MHIVVIITNFFNAIESKTYNGTVVSVNTPRMDAGMYWGYRVRIARSLGAAIAECPYEVCCVYSSNFIGTLILLRVLYFYCSMIMIASLLFIYTQDGYDLSIGTSDGGDSVEELKLSSFKYVRNMLLIPVDGSFF